MVLAACGQTKTARLDNHWQHLAVNQVACSGAAPLQANCCRPQGQVSLLCMLEALLSVPEWLCNFATMIVRPSQTPWNHMVCRPCCRRQGGGDGHSSQGL